MFVKKKFQYPCFDRVVASRRPIKRVLEKYRERIWFLTLIYNVIVPRISLANTYRLYPCLSITHIVGYNKYIFPSIHAIRWRFYNGQKLMEEMSKKY